LSAPSHQLEAIQALADHISDASSPEELLALLEQMVANCSEIIGALLTDNRSTDHSLSNNELT